MKLSNTISYTEGRFGIEKTVTLYKNAGFDTLDYMLNQMTADDNIFNGDNYRERAEYIKDCAKAAGLSFSQTHSPFSFKEWETTFDSNIRPRILRSLEICALLGAKTAIVHPLHYFTYRGNEEEIFELNMKFYRGLIPYCREYGIKIAIENMWHTDKLRGIIVDSACSRSEEFIRYIDTLDSEFIVACLDVGHVGLIEREDEAEDVIRALGHDRLKALHIHDNNYRGDQHLIPGQGKMHWDKIAEALGEINYSGELTFEAEGSFLRNYDDEFYPVALRFMSDVGRHIISVAERNNKSQ